MNLKEMKKTAALAALSALLLAALLGGATFAWFSNNSQVSTNTATGRSGTSSLKLLIGGDEGSLQEATETGVEIQQVNSAELTKLYPVSTADLSGFFYATSFDEEGNACSFARDDNEELFYHGKLFLRMEGNNISETATYKLYLDSSEKTGGVLGQSNEGYLLNASRLGLKFSDRDPIILRFAENSKGETKMNTKVNGTLISNGDVLSDISSTTSDPSEEFEVYQLDSENFTSLPEKELAVLKVNETVELDIYFYLEGCDEDCLGSISKNECEIHLSFYAIAD